MARRNPNAHKTVKAKHARASRTKSKRARIYFAYPPEGGWPGGDPRQNGFRAGGMK